MWLNDVSSGFSCKVGSPWIGLVCPVLMLMWPLVVLLAGQEEHDWSVQPHMQHVYCDRSLSEPALTVCYSSSSLGLDHPGQPSLPTCTSEP